MSWRFDACKSSLKIDDQVAAPAIRLCKHSVPEVPAHG